MRNVQPKQKKALNQPKPLKWRAIIALGLVLILISLTGHKIQNNNNSSKGLATKFNKTQYSLNDPQSMWAVVNKGRVLPGDFVPADLVVPNVPLRLPDTDPETELKKNAATALEQMVGAASQQNIHLMLSSGYRSYNEQVGLYKGYVSAQGRQSADSTSARPGHSEHQLGLAADLEPASRDCEVEVCFADTNEGKWLAANAYKYGFIIRYQKSQEKLTGYEYEPWHVRYVGKALSQQIHQTNQTLEQFFNLPSYSDYPANPYVLSVNG
jgi:D-alanyl-D-alanine carboxypeptidase